MEELDITSLLDILVILLVFLLQNYHITKIEIELQKNVNIPFSVTQDSGINAAVVQVTKEKEVWFNKEFLGNLSSKDTYIKLRDAMIAHKQKLMNPGKGERAPGTEDIDLEELRELRHSVNLVFDETIKYSIIHNVMELAAGSGFPKFKLIVRSDT